MSILQEKTIEPRTLWSDESTGELSALIPWELAEIVGLDEGSKITFAVGPNNTIIITIFGD